MLRLRSATIERQSDMAYHTIQVTTAPAPVNGTMEDQATVFELFAQGNCRREFAVDQAQNAIRFGRWKRALVFAGKGALSKLVYQCEALPDESTELETPDERAHAHAYRNARIPAQPGECGSTIESPEYRKARS